MTSSGTLTKKPSRLLSVGLGTLMVCVLVWGVLFLNNLVTLGGVPVSIVGEFLQDRTALSAFLRGEPNQLHRRLQELGVEEEIKDYYRPQIHDEVRLDQYIHQIFYNWTGYVGDDYFVTPQGVLVLRISGELRLKQELKETETLRRHPYPHLTP